MVRAALYLDNADIKIQLGRVQLNILYLRSHSQIRFIAQHSHKCYEVHYIYDGLGTLVSEGKKYKLNPGTFYITGPDVEHEQIGDELKPMGEYCMCFELINSNPSEKNLLEDGDDISNILAKTNFWIGRDEYNSIELFEKLEYEVNNQFIGYYINIKNYIQQIIINQIRSYTRNQRSKNALPTKSKDDKRLVIIESYLNNFTSKLSINEISKELSLSTRQTDRIIKKYYGISFASKVIQLRMEFGARLLCSTSLSITKISMQVGFSNIYDFCKCFKKYYGISASEYRKKNKYSYS